MTITNFYSQVLGYLAAIAGQSGAAVPLLDRSLGSDAARLLKSSSAKLYSCSCVNLNASVRYLQFFDSTSLPTAGAVPFHSYPVYGNGGLLVLDSVQFGSGDAFVNGLAWGISSTPLSYTAGTAAETIVIVRYS